MTKSFIYLTAIALLLLLCQTDFTQVRALDKDSLLQVIQGASPESDRLHASVLLAQQIMPGQMDSALILLDNASALENSRTLLHRAQYFNTRGLNYWFSGDRQTSIHWYRKTLALADDPAILHFQAAAANNIGNHLFRLGEPDSTRHYLVMSLDIDTERGHKEGMAKTMYDLSRMYFSQNQYELSLMYVTEAIKLQLELDDPMPLLRFYNVLGINYASLSQFERAAEAYLQSYQYARQFDCSDEEIVFYSNMAALLNNSALHQDLQDKLPDTVLYYTQKGLALAESTQQTKHVVPLLTNEAQALFDAGDPSGAIELFREAMAYIQDHGHVHFEMDVAHRKGVAYRTLNMLAEARKFQQRSLELAEARKSPLRQSEALFEIAMLDSLQGNYLDFARHYAQAVAYRDSVWNNEHRLRIAELQILHEMEQKELEIDRLQRINQINRTRQNLILLAIVLFAMLVIAMVRNHRKNRLIGRQKLEISRQEKDALAAKLRANRQELTGKALSLAKSEELINNMKKEMQAILKKSGNSQDEFSALLRNLKRQDNSKALWKEFEKRFEELSDGFIKRLTSRYPDLSPSEIRLCAMLRLQMSTKEIAELIKRSPRTIEHTRASVRRKMELKSCDSLLQHLLNL